MSNSIKIAGRVFNAGERGEVQIEVGHLHDFTEMNIPVEVICGKKPGPTLFISGAIHGDEINGVEIIRKVLEKINVKTLSGNLLAIPVVNVFGFNNRSRYLPDRRDLNRSFPGSKKGSLASQMAKKFMDEIVGKSTHGMDFHTGAIHRYNIAQIRAFTDNPETREMAKAFHPKVIIHSAMRDGSLREAARKKGIPMLLFEGGEALRFDKAVIDLGVKGAFRVMKHLKMIDTVYKKPGEEKNSCLFAEASYWVRAPHGGTIRFVKKPGDMVEKDDILGFILDLFGKNKIEVTAPEPGMIVGQTRLPLVNRGDGLFHIATGTQS